VARTAVLEVQPEATLVHQEALPVLSAMPVLNSAAISTAHSKVALTYSGTLEPTSAAYSTERSRAQARLAPISVATPTLYSALSAKPVSTSPAS